MTEQNQSYILNYENVLCDHEELLKINAKVKHSRIPGEIKWHPKQTKCSLTNTIETFLVDNNEKYSRFPDDYIHCLMSLDVYRKNIKKDQHLADFKYWRVLEIFENKDYDYYAILYINEKRGQLVLSHRGYDVKTKDIFEENNKLKSFFKDILVKNMLYQHKFCYENAKHANEIAEKKGYFLSFTGYSNGAWLAEYCNFYSFYYLNKKNTKAVLFDSPGIFHEIKILNQINNVVSRSTSMNANNLNQVNYLTTPCFTNSINLHVGNVYRIFVDVSYENSKIPGLKGWLAKRLITSKFILNGILAMFDFKILEEIVKIFDRKTGRPIYYEEIKNWPVIKISKNPNNAKEKMREAIGAALEYVPVPGVAPWGRLIAGMLCSVVEKILNKITPNFVMICNISYHLMSRNVDVSNFEDPRFYLKFEEIKGLANNCDDSNKAAIAASEFTIFILKNYEPICDMTLKREWNLSNEYGNLDWCLINLQKVDLSNESDLILNFSNDLKKRYTIKDSEENVYECYEQCLCVTSNQSSYDILIEKMARLIQICPDIRRLLQIQNQVIS